MLKQIHFEEEEPLIQINWRRLWKYCRSFFVAVLLIIKKVLETILKLIIKLLTLLLLGIYKLHDIVKKFLIKVFNAIKKFSKRNVKGFWIIALITVILFISGVFLIKSFQTAKAYTKQLQEMDEVLNERNKENEQLQEEIKEKDAQLEAKALEKQKLANKQWVIANRNRAQTKLPEEVKSLIAQNAIVYGVKDVRLIECTVYHESGGRDEAVGDNGSAIGVAQYHLGTFLGHRRQMGLPVIDLRTDTEASIQAMVFSVSRGGIGNWTAHRKCI